MLPISRTLDLVLALYFWITFAALEMKQTSHNAGTMGWEFTTVCPVKMLVFSAVQVDEYKWYQKFVWPFSQVVPISSLH